MASNLTQPQTAAITNALSPLRLGTYAAAAGFSASADTLEKYMWNALLSGAFFSSLHICEVAVRNGVAAVIERQYGNNWPWSVGFETSLPNPPQPYFSPRRELKRARNSVAAGATGKVIAELKFAFWCEMFTSRHDGRLWKPFIFLEFPHLPMPLLPEQHRKRIYDDLTILRKFRNRVAHHEPIIADALVPNHKRIKDLVAWRCASAELWLQQWETVTATLAAKP